MGKIQKLLFSFTLKASEISLTKQVAHCLHLFGSIFSHLATFKGILLKIFNIIILLSNLEIVFKFKIIFKSMCHHCNLSKTIKLFKYLEFFIWIWYIVSIVAFVHRSFLSNSWLSLQTRSRLCFTPVTKRRTRRRRRTHTKIYQKGAYQKAKIWHIDYSWAFG